MVDVLQKGQQVMQSRKTPGLRTRREKIGGVCYVPVRDDFFALSPDVYRFLSARSSEWEPVGKADRKTIVALSKLGICETKDPTTRQRAYSGPSFVGVFEEIPTVSEPLVLNCFCTAHCPLKCTYCHADDLMKEYRQEEDDGDLNNVVATSNSIPAMVAVITGGDPLTRPARAQRLINKLAGGKALVLDTSGVGDITTLIPVLKDNQVHVRVSLDAISPLNDQVRPVNPNYLPTHTSCRESAQRTIQLCLSEGIPVTVQTVVSSRNENLSEWLDLRDAIADWGVRHWVLHVAVRGGSARRVESAAERAQSRKRGILPSREVYESLHRLVRQSESDGVSLDIRVTDTGNTPNSVLLVGSKGDLFTEGYAHQGKVCLYEAGKGRPDLLRSLWPHLDRFGHARRYLNWNPWFYSSQSLRDICYEIDVPPKLDATRQGVVETEVKHSVLDTHLLQELLQQAGFKAGKPVFQRDEYYDNADQSLASLDFVVRIRRDDAGNVVAMKGPRFYTPRGEYSRVELEIRPESWESAREDVEAKNLTCTWFFEKRRTSFVREPGESVVLDEIPELGFYVEIEGDLVFVRELMDRLADALGARETRNYAELFRDHKDAQGVAQAMVKGAEFDKEP